MNSATSILNLAPVHAHTIQFPYFKYTQQTQGSFYWQLRRVSRTPAFSRPYVAGDPIRLVDWRAFARNDQLIVREQRENASVKIVVILDYSHSMLWPDVSIEEFVGHPLGMKIEIATRIALNLCFMHLKAGDEITVLPVNFSEGNVPSQLTEWGVTYRFRSSADILGIYNEYVQRGFSKSLFPNSGLMERRPVERYDLIYVLSDSFKREMLEHLIPSSKHLHLMQVLSSLETNQDWIKPQFAYLEESNEDNEYLGQVLLGERGLSSRAASWREGLRQWLTNRGSSYQLVTDRTSIEEYFALLSRMTKD